MKRPTRAQATSPCLPVDLKPHLRGWLRTAMVPPSVAAGIVLIALAPTHTARVAAYGYTLPSWLLFTVSAVYHRGRWSPHTK